MSTIKIDGPLMNELRQKPEGSHIEETETFDGRTYRWKPPSGGPLRFFIAGFLSLWLVGWCAGFVAAANELIKGGNINQRFLAIWLAGWTIGGIFAVTMLYFLLRPPRPEQITLSRNSFHYDSGSTSPVMFMNPWYAMRHSNPHDAFKHLFPRRKRIEIEKAQLGNVVLDRVGERQRLYFDHGADRIEIGEHLREPEREWLAAVIDEWKST